MAAKSERMDFMADESKCPNRLGRQKLTRTKGRTSVISMETKAFTYSYENAERAFQGNVSQDGMRPRRGNVPFP